jgi:hypothetical protein
MTMGVGRFGILMVLAAIVAAPVLAQEAAPPAPRQKPPLREVPAPLAPPWTNPPKLRTQQSADPCDATRGRMIREPELSLPQGELLVPGKPRPFEPGRDAGRICPATPAI